MARETSVEDLDKLLVEENKNLEAKKKEFASKGKTFRQDSYGPGVVPDDIYDSLRDPNDPKYRKGV